MLNNTSFNNVTVVVANENSNLKEDKNMMNNTMNNEAAVVIAMTKEEIEMMTKDQIRVALEAVGVEMSNNTFKKTKKAELVAMLEQYLDPTKKVEVVQAEVAAPVVPAVGNVVNTVKEETVMVEKNMKYEKLMKAVAKEIIAQTLVLKDGKMVQRDYALFFKPTKTQTECQDYIVMGKRLWGVVSSVIAKVYGEQNKTKENIDQTLDQMVAWDMITKVAAERTYATLNPADMSQDEKDQLNDLWRTKDIKTEKTKDGKVKVTAVTDNGKAVLNELYPSWTYRATVAQMNNIYKLSK